MPFQHKQEHDSYFSGSHKMLILYRKNTISDLDDFFHQPLKQFGEQPSKTFVRPFLQSCAILYPVLSTFYITEHPKKCCQFRHQKL
jgi:hypothetical protein